MSTPPCPAAWRSKLWSATSNIDSGTASVNATPGQANARQGDSYNRAGRDSLAQVFSTADRQFESRLPVPHRLTLQTRFVRLLLVGVAALFASGCAGGERPVLTQTTLPEEVPTPALQEEPVIEPAAEAVVPTEVPAVEAAVAGCLTDRQWIGQTVMALATQNQLPEARALAEAGELNGITILGLPDAGISDAIADLDTAGPFPVLMASDEEGGLVQRLGELINPLPAAATQTARSVDDVRAEFAAYAMRMKELGFDIAFAPVVDIGGGPGIGSRSFGSDPTVVTDYARATAEGFREGGILPVYKHFPGHGRASTDTHIELAVTPAYSDLVGLDLLPYDALLAEPGAAVMVAHLSVPGLSDETPTSLSPNTVTRLLRGEGGETIDGKSYNFAGLVFSDALNMGAIVNTYGVPDAAIRSLSAGVDVVILGGPGDVSPVIDAVLAAIGEGRMSWEQIDDSAQRVMNLKGVVDAVRCAP